MNVRDFLVTRLALLGICLLTVSALVVALAPASSPPPAGLEVPFAASSPFRQAIPADATVDPKSAQMIARVTRTNMVHASLVEYGIPIWTAGPDTSRYWVPCTRTSWGECPFSTGYVPIPDDAHPNTGSDGAMVVVDPEARKVFEFWQARRSDGGWETSFGAINDLDGSGWGGQSTGSGASRLAGVVRVAEIQQGDIPHALVLQSDNVCAGLFRWPALKTDGQSNRSDCIPEGARIRLDPAVDVAKLPRATAAEKAVARALQVYGAFLIDRGTAPLSVSFELAHDASGTFPGRTYRQFGLPWDYYGMPDIPWSRLQVMSE